MEDNPASTPRESQCDSSSQKDGQPPSKVRARTIRHLRKMLASAGATGAALCMSGCAVVDPLPPPVDCTADITASSLSETWALSWYAQWTQTGEQPRILVKLTVYDIESNLTFPGDLTLDGATLLESDITEYSIRFVCTPIEGAVSATISLPVQCEEATHTINLFMDVSRTPELGERVPISAEDEE